MSDRVRSKLEALTAKWDDQAYRGAISRTVPDTAVLGNGDVGVTSGGRVGAVAGGDRAVRFDDG